MSKKDNHHLFWDLYSDKIRTLIASRPHAKTCEGKSFSHEKLGISYRIDLYYDEQKEMFTEMKYLVTGPTFMIAFLEGLAETVLNKKITTVSHFRADELLESLGTYEIADRTDDDDLSEYVQFLSPFANHVIDSYATIVEEKVPTKYTTPEALRNFSVDGEGIANFFELEKPVQISHIETVMERDIRPYVALDDGGVKIKDLTKNGVVFIQYEGNCTSCHAASSTTLSAITSILKAKVHEKLEVLPFLG